MTAPGSRRFTRQLVSLLLSRGFVPICAAVFVLVRLAMMLLLPVTPVADSHWYISRAFEMANGEGYHYGLLPTAYWPVGYPAFLAGVFTIFGHNLLAAKLANLMISFGIFVLTYRLSVIMFGNLLAARCALLLLTIYPNQIAYTGVLLSELLVSLLFLLGIFVFVREPVGRWAPLLAGLVFGAAALVKAQMLYMPAILLGLQWWYARSGLKWSQTLALTLRFTVPRGALVALGMALVVLPWSYRNTVAMHSFVLISTNGGPTFLAGNNPEARGDFAPDSPLVEQANITSDDQVAADRRSYALGKDWIRQNPVAFGKLVPLKIWHLWAPDGDGEWWFQAGYDRYSENVVAFRTARGINQLFYAAVIIVWLMSFRPLWRCAGADRPWVLLTGWIALYVTLISIVYFGESRFHFPEMPLILIQAGWGLAYWLGRPALAATAGMNRAGPYAAAPAGAMARTLDASGGIARANSDWCICKH